VMVEVPSEYITICSPVLILQCWQKFIIYGIPKME